VILAWFWLVLGFKEGLYELAVVYVSHLGTWVSGVGCCDYDVLPRWTSRTLELR